MRSFKSSEYINEKGGGQYPSFIQVIVVFHFLRIKKGITGVIARLHSYNGEELSPTIEI